MLKHPDAMSVSYMKGILETVVNIGTGFKHKLASSALTIRTQRNP